jgi:hypothetical protein
MKLDGEASPLGNRSLRIHLDGGGGVAQSPTIPARALFGYVLEGVLKTKDLEHDRAFLSLTFLDDQERPLERIDSQRVADCPNWKRLRLGPVSPQDDRTRWAVIGLHLEPQTLGRRQDLHGAASFSDLWLGRLPRLTLGSGSRTGVASQRERMEIDCTVSGYLERRTRVSFQLEDVFSRTLTEDQQQPVFDAASGAMAIAADQGERMPLVVGHIRWKPPLPGPGFYRVRAVLPGPAGRPVCQQAVTLALIEPLAAAESSEFGWSLPRGDRPLPLTELGSLVYQAGVRWLKYPLWYDGPQSEGKIDQFQAFNDRLNAHGIEVVGMLARPLAESGALPEEANLLSAADVFAADPEKWYPAVEPLMNRLAAQIRWWQLGHDGDTSFVGYPNLAAKIEQVRGTLNRFGQEVSLGLGWGWVNCVPPVPGRTAPWRFLSLSAAPPLTQEELGVYLDATAGAKTDRWAVLEPLPRGKYPVEVRAADLVRRMIAAKIHKAQGIFVPDPLDDEQGLMNSDGTVGELFTAWRTTALLLGGSVYLGHNALPNGSPNQVFARTGGAVMVLWNDRPADESLYLGENLRQFDLWGRSVTPESRPEGQVIHVDRLPTFVVGLSEAVARWRMDFALDHEQIPSIFGQGHANSFRLKNSFRQEVSGRATLVAPEGWRVVPKQTAFHLSPAEELRQPFQVILPSDAAVGEHDIRIDFDIQADHPYRFSEHRRLVIGLGDIVIQVHTQLNARGDLEVEQRVVNQTAKSVNFRCQLFAPSRQRLKVDIVELGPGAATHVYRLVDGKELLGRKLWIRAEEFGGVRVFNYRFPAEP